jgi:putative transposase
MVNPTHPSRAVASTRTSTGAAERWRSRNVLPHFDVPGLIQHITFHLADSLPKQAIERMQMEVDLMPESNRAVARRQWIQQFLDQGIGSCVLGHPDCAEIVQESLLFGDGDRYRLFAWVVMPNHVHVLIEQLPGWPMRKVVQGWKRHTSRRIHRLGFDLMAPICTAEDVECNSTIPGGSALWHRNYWDRYIRNDRHFAAAKQYVEDNPVTAGLVDSAEEWPCGSAAFGQDSGVCRC